MVTLVYWPHWRALAAHAHPSPRHCRSTGCGACTLAPCHLAVPLMPLVVLGTRLGPLGLESLQWGSCNQPHHFTEVETDERCWDLPKACKLVGGRA